MKSIGSPTEFCHEIGLQFATKADKATPFEDVETALSLIEDNATESESVSLNEGSEAIIFETVEGGQDVDYIYNEDTLYRRS